jgi:hypothetical protein
MNVVMGVIAVAYLAFVAYLTNDWIRRTIVQVELLICSCGDCLHWELTPRTIICKSCGKEFPVPGLKELLQEHVDLHPELSWAQHER